MNNQLSMWLTRRSSGRIALLFFSLFIMFTVLVLPGRNQHSLERSAGSGTPDLSLFYSADDLYRMAEAYGESGRQDYIHERFTFDLVFPLIYTAFLLTSISWSEKKAGLQGTRWQVVNLLPLAILAFDLLENTFSAIIMARYPAFTLGLDQVVPVMTFSKWLLIGMSFLALIFFNILGLWNKARST